MNLSVDSNAKYGSIALEMLACWGYHHTAEKTKVEDGRMDEFYELWRSSDYSLFLCHHHLKISAKLMANISMLTR